MTTQSTHPTSHLQNLQAPPSAQPVTESQSEAERAALEFLHEHEQKSLMRFVTIGSVDDGKSTLIGRLLYDTDSVYDDQLAALRKSAGPNGEIDLSLLTDGLEAERQQGITIDVAYRYFSTKTRKFIIADTPGHVQYTRNMATGASTADLAIILVDARLGVLPQSRRHAFIASLLGIKHLIVAINKMDLVGFAGEVFDAIVGDFTPFVGPLFERVAFLPICAKDGDNIVKPSARMPWWDGSTILSHLEAAPITKLQAADRFVMPVQYVLRPDLNFRGFCGTIAAGRVRVGDEVEVLPSGKRTHVKQLVSLDGSPAEGFAPQAVTLTLADEIDVIRGDVLAHPGHGLRVTQHLAATLVWLNEQSLQVGRVYLFKHTSRSVSGEISQVCDRIDMETLAREPSETLQLNDVGGVLIRLNRPFVVTRYRENRVMGAFIIIDRITNATVAAGIINDDASDTAFNPRALAASLEQSNRARRFAQRACLLSLRAADPAFAAEVAHRLDRRLCDDDHLSFVLDSQTLPALGDVVGSVIQSAVLCKRIGLLTICTIPLENAAREILQNALTPDDLITITLNPDADDLPADALDAWFIPTTNPADACDQIVSRMRQHQILRR